MLNDQLKVTGDVVVEITGPDGQIKDRREIKNLVVSTGKTFIASRIVGTPTAMSHMAIGVGPCCVVIFYILRRCCDLRC